MKISSWVITGATSIIAKEFAHVAAQAGHALYLVARDEEQLNIIAADIRLRYQVKCEIIVVDFSQDISLLLKKLLKIDIFNLFIAHSLIINNEKLYSKTNRLSVKNDLLPHALPEYYVPQALIQTNITSTVELIHHYLNKNQNQHRLIYLSSVAACRGRAKNSLYGASKAAIEVYLEGLQQVATNNKHITIARLGFIDTKSTYGEPGIFYAASPEACAKACWRASIANKRLIYYPFFWRNIMAIIRSLPFFIYKKMGSI